MRLSQASVGLLAVMAICLCLAPGSWAQARQARKKTVPKAKAAAQAAKPAAQAEPAPAPAAGKAELASKRDPFAPLINDKKDTAMLHLPPGKAGLVVATVHVDGTVRSSSGMIASGFQSGRIASILSGKVIGFTTAMWRRLGWTE